jgi:Lar family restriction alleviation protein
MTMTTRNSTRTRKARGSKTPDAGVSPEAALHAWYIAKQNGAFEQRERHVQRHFELDNPWIPLIDLPLAKPCPFCGKVDSHIVLDEVKATEHSEGHVAAHVECDNCGVEGPYGIGKRSYDAIREAAYHWNRREGGAK